MKFLTFSLSVVPEKLLKEKEEKLKKIVSNLKYLRSKQKSDKLKG